MSYKQKRFENNVTVLLTELANRVQRMENRIQKLPVLVKTAIKEVVFPLVFDYTVDERQVAKIRLIANGIETIITEGTVDEDRVIKYYGTLQETTVDDIRLLVRIINSKNEPVVRGQVQITTEEQAFERHTLNRLERFGLIYIPDFVYDYDKNNEMYHLKDIRLTPFGEMFLRFFQTINLDI